MCLPIITGDQEILINNCGPAICCFFYSILTSYCEPKSDHSYLSTNRPGMSGYELLNGLNVRSYAFHIHFRKLCYTRWMCNELQTDPGLLLTNKRSMKGDNINTYYEEPNFENSSSISDNDGFYY